MLKQDEDGWVHLAPWTRGNRREYIILDGCDFYVSLERSDQVPIEESTLFWMVATFMSLWRDLIKLERY